MPPQEPQATGSVPYGDPGVGGVSAGPAAVGMPLPDILQATKAIAAAVGAGSGPTATVPYINAPKADVARHTLPPTMLPTDQNTQVRPYNNSLKAQREAKAQSWGNLLGNMIGTVVNDKARQAYADKEATIKEYGDAATQAKKAQKILEYYKNDPNNPAVKEAQESLASANNTLQKIQNDNKQWRVVEKAYKNYEEGVTDPSKLDEYGKAYQSGVSKVAQSDQQGLGADTPAEAATHARAAAIERGQNPQAVGIGAAAANAGGLSPQERAAQAQGSVTPDGRRPLTQGGPNQGVQMSPSLNRDLRSGSPQAAASAGAAWQPRINIPTELQANPEYAAAQERAQKFEEIFLRTVYPTMIRDAGQTTRAIATNTSRELQTEMRANASVETHNIDAKAKLDVASTHAAEEIYKVNAKISAVGSMALNPKTAGAAAFIGNRELAAMDTRISKAQSDYAKDESDVTKMEADAREASLAGQTARRAELEDNIRVVKQRMKNENAHIEKLQKAQAQLEDTLANIPESAKTGQPTAGLLSSEKALNKALGIDTGEKEPAPAGSTGVKDVDRWSQTVTGITSQEQYSNVPANLATAVINAESTGNPDAIPRGKDLTAEDIAKGGKGLMGLTPSIVKKYNVSSVFNPGENIRGGVAYLSDLIKKNNGDIKKALYDYGPHEKDPGYVDRVYNAFQKLESSGSAEGGGDTSGGGGTSTDSTGSGGGAGGAASTQAGDASRFIQQSATDIGGQQPAANTSPGVSTPDGQLGAIQRLLQKTGG